MPVKMRTKAGDIMRMCKQPSPWGGLGMRLVYYMVCVEEGACVGMGMLGVCT